MKNSVVITVDGRPHHFLGPGDWADLTPTQYLEWCRSLNVEAGTGQFALLQRWYGLRYRDVRLLDDEQKVQLLAVLDWTHERPSRWMIPTLGSRLGYFDGPGDRLAALTFGEFMFAEAARAANLRAELAGALYHPRSNERAFSERGINERGTRFAKLPAEMLEGILINYLGCLDIIGERFRRVFPLPKTGDDEELNLGSDSSSNWLDIALGLARQTGALGTFQQLQQTNLFLVLPVLEQLLKEQAELQKLTTKNGYGNA